MLPEINVPKIEIGKKPIGLYKNVLAGNYYINNILIKIK